MKKEAIYSVQLNQKEAKANRSVPIIEVWQTKILSFSYLVRLAHLYSAIMEQAISPLQTLYLLHVQLAFTLLIFPFSLSVLVRFIFLIWTVIALLLCRSAIYKKTVS